MDVPYLDLAIRDNEQRKSLLESIEKVLKHGQLINGPEVILFEEEIKKRTNRLYALACSSGTDALYLAFIALNLPKGSEVLIPVISWVSIAHACILAGYIPKFVDCQDDYQVNFEDLKKKITSSIRAVVLVNLSGIIGDTDKIISLCKENNIFLIEDASQSFLSKKDNTLSGGFGDISCASLNPMKSLSALGEAGIITTDNQEIHESLLHLRYIGMKNKKDAKLISLNFRMDTIQAACLLNRLATIDQSFSIRRKLANQYSEALKDLALKLPYFDKETIPYNFPVQFKNSQKLSIYLKKNSIETKDYDSHFLLGHTSLQQYADDHYQNSKNILAKTLLLPFHESIDKEKINYVCTKIRQFYQAE